MKSLLISFAIVIAAISQCPGQSKKDQQQALEYGRTAVRIMDEGKYEEAIELLKKAEKLDPNQIDYPYEIAYAYYSMEDYKKALKLLEQIIDHKDVTEHNFQLLGNCYDILGKQDKAIEVYQSGLKKFPDSGKLYLEQGIVEFFRENYDQAIAYWEKGVEVDPGFPSNYYWLGKIFSYSDERIWSVLYGEVFVNLERNSERTMEMSKLLFDTYKASIDIDSGTTGGVSFSKIMVVDPGKKFKVPFQMTFGLTMTMSLALNILNAEEEISIGSLNTIRQNFISTWFDQKRDKDYPNVLFDFQKVLQEKDFLEAYNYWFLMKGNEDEFGMWYEKNQVKFDAFVDWFTNNPLEINRKNYFSRLNY